MINLIDVNIITFIIIAFVLISSKLSTNIISGFSNCNFSKSVLLFSFGSMAFDFSFYKMYNQYKFIMVFILIANNIQIF